VGDYDPVDIHLVSQLVDPLGQRQPLFIGHILARNLENLFATNIGDVLQVGDRLNQCINRNRCSLVANRCRRCCSRACDCAASRQYDYRRQMFRSGLIRCG